MSKILKFDQSNVIYTTPESRNTEIQKAIAKRIDRHVQGDTGQKTPKKEKSTVSASEESILVMEIVHVPKIVCTIHFKRLALVGDFPVCGARVHHQLVDPSHHVLLEILH